VAADGQHDIQAQRLRSQRGRIRARNRQGPTPKAFIHGKCGRPLDKRFHWSDDGAVIYFECHRKRCRFRTSMSRQEYRDRLAAAADADEFPIVLD
jgi:hypothetical protein